MCMGCSSTFLLKACEFATIWPRSEGISSINEAPIYHGVNAKQAPPDQFHYAQQGSLGALR